MNVYVHFPFCRSKCAYCALHSRAGSSSAVRSAHVARAAAEFRRRVGRENPRTVYFGGGSPALCDLSLFGQIEAGEFTVELHPLDATDAMLDMLWRIGVNRVSMGAQSFDDDTLAAMARGHTAAEAEAAFKRIRARFPNAGLDLICGLPAAGTGGVCAAFEKSVERALSLEPAHVSCYSLIREPRTVLDMKVARGDWTLPGDDETMDALRTAAAKFAAAGLARYEISNWARPGLECKHNLAVWHGEDYIGIGEGARGRAGLVRTYVAPGGKLETETLSPEQDAVERALFRLRLAEGVPVSTAERFGWLKEFDALVAQGIIKLAANSYSLTERGTEVCDAVMASLAR